MTGKRGFDDSRTGYLSGAAVTTRYRGQAYALSDVLCVTRLAIPAAPVGDCAGVLAQPGPGNACGHPLLSHSRPEGTDGLWGRCGRCACQGHTAGFDTESPVWCLYCAREMTPRYVEWRVNRLGKEFPICPDCDRKYPQTEAGVA